MILVVIDQHEGQFQLKIWLLLKLTSNAVNEIATISQLICIDSVLNQVSVSWYLYPHRLRVVQNHAQSCARYLQFLDDLVD